MQLKHEEEYDYILAGGGLQAAMLVLAIRQVSPDAAILVVERGESFGGNHTWSFHRRDIPSSADWVDRLPLSRWDSYKVRFPGYVGQVPLEYASISSSALARVIEDQFDASLYSSSRLLLNTRVQSIESRAVETSDGARYLGRCVIDCRGRSAVAEQGDDRCGTRLGYQKFFGAEIELEDEWPTNVPMLMDACVEQEDGFHFVYVLPFSRKRVLVEDTWFSDDPHLDHDACAKRVRSYVTSQTKSQWSVARLESGCLPMPIRGLSPLSRKMHESQPLRGGYAGGWFHAATGYSFPLAVKFALAVASVDPEQAGEAIERLRVAHQKRFRFARFLNRLLFRLVRPECRWQVFRRLYRSLPTDTLARFYAHEFTVGDAIRMVIGIPPSGLRPIRFVRGDHDEIPKTDHPVEAGI